MTRHFGDGARHLAATRLLLSGGNPYVPGFLYAPPALVMGIPFALLPDQLALPAWALIQGCLLAGCVWLATRNWPVRDRTLTVIATLAFAPVAADLLLGNVTVACCVSAWWVVRGGSGFAFGIALAAVPKPMLFPILLWAIIHRRPGARQAILAAAVVTALMLPLGMEGSFLTALRTTPQAFTGDNGLASISVPAWAVGFAAGFVGFLLALWRGDATVALAWACASGLVLAPYTGLYAGVPLLIPALELARRYPWRVAIVGHGAVALQLALPISAAAVAAGTVAAATFRRPPERAGNGVQG